MDSRKKDSVELKMTQQTAATLKQQATISKAVSKEFVGWQTLATVLSFAHGQAILDSEVMTQNGSRDLHLHQQQQ